MKNGMSWKKWGAGILLAAAAIGALFWVQGIIGGQPEPVWGHKGHLLGATYMSRSNPFFDILHESIEEVVEGNGDTIISREPAQDQEKQNEQIQDMIDEGIEVLFLNPVNWEEVQPALEACREAGIPVFNVDTKVKDTEYVVSIIESDNYEAGVQCAQDMIQRVKEAGIFILDYPVQTSVTDRVNGFLDTIAGHEEYQVICQEAAFGELEVGAEVTVDILEKGIDFDVILGGNDPMALGALSALQQRGLNEKILIYGIDGSPDSKAMINLGYMTGSCAQSPKSIGKTAALMAYQYLAGKEVEEYVSIAPVMITKDNIGEFEINAWE